MRFLDALLPNPPAPPVRGFRPPGLRRGLVNFGGHTYMGLPISTTWSNTPSESISVDFDDLVQKTLYECAPVAAVEQVRTSVFSQARFLWQRFNNGRPGDLFGAASLAILETPWQGGTTGDLLKRMLLHADFAGNAYVARIDDELALLRPDWTDIVLTPRRVSLPGGEIGSAGWKRIGYAYYDGGDRSKRALVFTLAEVAHFAPEQDPLATYRGRSWLSPVIAEIQGDKGAAAHKTKFFENSATPNLSVQVPKEISVDDFDEFVEKFEELNAGPDKAGKTMYLGGGADVTVIGANMRQLDFKAVQGAGETRIAAVSGVGAVLAKLSEGMQGSSLNAGNFKAARRLFTDTTAQDLWRNAAGSLQQIVPAPAANIRLWFDGRDIPFLRDDELDVAQRQQAEAVTMKTLVDAAWVPESIVSAVSNDDWSLLTHTGLSTVQVQDTSPDDTSGS